MAKRDLSPGTTPEWARARKQALDRDGWRCTQCGKTQEQAKADSPAGRGLEVHHVRGEGVRSRVHRLEHLRTLCRDCHLDTLRKQTRPDWRKQKQEQGRRAAEKAERARARR
ncbi:MAG: HNH endonuclease [Thermoleophilaceae bacterium]|nr:HNH endonuclease [Thermoleophilaceae bacterium]